MQNESHILLKYYKRFVTCVCTPARACINFVLFLRTFRSQLHITRGVCGPVDQYVHVHSAGRIKAVTKYLTKCSRTRTRLTNKAVTYMITIVCILFIFIQLFLGNKRRRFAYEKCD